MKSVGEVMAIGRSFQEAMQKAIRMAAPGASRGLSSHRDVPWSLEPPTSRGLSSH